MQDQAKKVLEKLAQANSSPIISVQDIVVDQIPDGTLSVHTPGNRRTSIELSLKGRFQRDNAAAALAAIGQLEGRGFVIPETAVRNGFRHVEKLSGLRARLQVIGRRPLLICDVAHNPDAIQALVDAVQPMAHKTVHLIFGVMKDKSYRPMIRNLGKLKPKFYAVEASIARSLPASTLREAIVDEGYAAECYATITAALSEARRSASSGDLILVTGSHYVVGEAMIDLMKPAKARAARGKKLT
jgi:dihydrofolate synthase/folylpolyglutamate synthase